MHVDKPGGQRHVSGSQASPAGSQADKVTHTTQPHPLLTHEVSLPLPPEAISTSAAQLTSAPSAVCLCELQESAAGHRHLHAHRDRHLHPDQRGLLHHPPHQRHFRQRRCSCGTCTHFFLFTLFLLLKTLKRLTFPPFFCSIFLSRRLQIRYLV